MSTVRSKVLPSVSMTTASSAARRGATARLRSRSSRTRSCSRTASASSPAGSRPRSSIRRIARSSTEASRNSLRSASGSTTVPMSRPATTIPPPSASARWRGSRAARTSPIFDTFDTAASTLGPRASSVVSAPSRRTRVRRPVPSSASVTRPTRSTRRGASSVGTPSRSAAAVSARYRRPVSTKRSPRRPAAAAPTLLLPLEAGPSSATTIRRPSSGGADFARDRGGLAGADIAPSIPAADAGDHGPVSTYDGDHDPPQGPGSQVHHGPPRRQPRGRRSPPPRPVGGRLRGARAAPLRAGTPDGRPSAPGDRPRAGLGAG